MDSSMDNVRLVLRVVHFVAWAALLGGLFPLLSATTDKRLGASVVWGARLAFLTGLLLTGVKEMLAKVSGDPVNHGKIGLKLLLGLVALGLVEMCRKKELSPALLRVLLGVLMVSVGVAVLWK